MHAVDEQMQRRWLNAEVPVRRDVLDELQGAAAQLACREDFRRHRRQCQIRGQYRHFEQHAARALGVDQQQVVARRERGHQVTQSQSAVRRMQQQRVQFAAVVVRQHQVQPGDGGVRHQLLGALLVVGQHLVDAGRRTFGQREVARQRGLHVQVQQQHAQPGVGREAAQVGRRRGLAHAALGRNDRNHLHGLLPVDWHVPEEASGALVEAFGDPLLDLHRVPAHGAHAQAQRLGELAFLHEAVDVGALEAGLGLDFGAAQDAVLGRRRRCCGLRRHERHSLTLTGAVRKVPRIE
mmetsp:Transcript_59156/g.139388  ORF Transcript_59156/g.139388 Transcript_59156/m.139388 type:complete len:294 (+) Transcript_59156:28-909(+)